MIGAGTTDGPITASVTITAADLARLSAAADKAGVTVEELIKRQLAIELDRRMAEWSYAWLFGGPR